MEFVSDESISELMRRLRSGDQEAARLVVRQYEAEIRTEVRSRMRDARLRRLVETMDIFQSVFSSFFLRVSLGQLDAKNPQALLNLFVRMVHGKVVDQQRRQMAARRDVRRTTVLNADVAIHCEESSDSDEVSHKLQQVRNCMSESERRVADLRIAGHSWTEVGESLKESPDAVRKRFDRAIERIGRSLKLEGF